MATRVVKVSRTQKGRWTNNDMLFCLRENTLDRIRKHEVLGARECVNTVYEWETHQNSEAYIYKKSCYSFIKVHLLRLKLSKFAFNLENLALFR